MRSLLTIPFVLLPLAGFGTITNAFAQATGPIRSEWFNAGISRSRPTVGEYETPVPNFNLNYNFGRENRFYQAGVDYVGSLSLGRPPYVIAASVGFGRRSFSRYHLAALSVGPAFVIGRWRRGWRTDAYGEVEKDVYDVVSPGLSADLQLIAKPLGFIMPELGAGIEIYANVNLHRSFYGLRLVFHGNNTR